MSKETPSGEIVAERRRELRTPYEAKATLSFGGAAFTAVTQNLNPHGAFFATNLSVDDATPVELTLDIHDGGGEIELTGRVVRKAASGDRTGGLAVEFDGIDDEDAERIRLVTRRS